LLHRVSVGASVIQDIHGLLQRLQQPTAAALSAEYANISKLPKFLSTLLPAPGCKLPASLLPQKQLTALFQRWCSLAAPLLLVVTDQQAFAQDPTGSAVYGAGTLLNALAAFLQYWVDVQADEVAAAAVKHQIAQYTAGGLVMQHCGWGGTKRGRGDSSRLPFRRLGCRCAITSLEAAIYTEHSRWCGNMAIQQPVGGLGEEGVRLMWVDLSVDAQAEEPSETAMMQ
jgi:hypothetical protein